MKERVGMGERESIRVRYGELFSVINQIDALENVTRGLSAL